MTTSSITPIFADPSAAANQFNREAKGPDAARQAAREFEAIFLRQMFKEALSPMINKTAENSSLSGDIYRDMCSDVLARSASSGQGLGLASMLATHLQAQATNSSPQRESVTHE